MYSKLAHLIVVYQLDRDQWFFTLYEKNMQRLPGWNWVLNRFRTAQVWKSGLKRCFLASLSPSSIPSIRPCVPPSVRPFWGVSAQRSGRTQNTSSLVCKRREKPLRGAQVLIDSLAGPNNFPSTSKTTNSDLFKASRPPGGVLWTNSHCLQRTGLRSALQDFGEADLLHPGRRCFSNVGHLKQKRWRPQLYFLLRWRNETRSSWREQPSKLRPFSCCQLGGVIKQKGEVSSSVQTDVMSFSFVCIPGLSFQRCRIRMWAPLNRIWTWAESTCSLLSPR